MQPRSAQSDPDTHASGNGGTDGPAQPRSASGKSGPGVAEMSPFLHSLTGRTDGNGQAASEHRVQEFLNAPSPARQLLAYLGGLPAVNEIPSIKRSIARDIARLDGLLTNQVNVILHHPDFQSLESAWRGLAYLVERAEEGREIIEEDGERGTIDIRVLNISRRELERDFDRAVEFDQSAMFRKVYEEEFGTAGGTPYGMLIANYSFTNHPDDVELLGQMSGVAAAAFAPLITSAAPELLGLSDFSRLEQPLNLEATFEQKEYVRWNSLRERPDAQFLGLTMPRVLMRKPYDDDGSVAAGFRFREDVEGPDRSRYLWGSAALAFGAVAIRAYAASGWFADIRGFVRGRTEGGLVTDLPSDSFHTDRKGVAVKSSTEVSLTDNDERALCQLGFIPLSDCADTEYSVFYSNQSAHKPQQYDDPLANANAKISSMMQYVLCCSRFAHYLKVLARTKIGSFSEAREIENWLNSWLVEYTLGDDRARPEMKARYPLREAECLVSPVPAEPGAYRLTINLRPHYQLDQLAASVRLVARIAPQAGTP